MTNQTVAVLGIDLGKNSCSVAGVDATGRVVLRRRLTRDGVMRLSAGMPACVMAMEACCGAHHLGRVLRAQGHEVRLMSPEYVQPYVKAQKNDERDAEAIAEAATRPRRLSRYCERPAVLSADCTGAVAERHGLAANDPSMSLFVTHVSAALNSLAKRNRVRRVGTVDGRKHLWEIAA